MASLFTLFLLLCRIRTLNCKWFCIKNGIYFGGNNLCQVYFMLMKWRNNVQRHKKVIKCERLFQMQMYNQWFGWTWAKSIDKVLTLEWKHGKYMHIAIFIIQPTVIYLLVSSIWSTFNCLLSYDDCFSKPR